MARDTTHRLIFEATDADVATAQDLLTVDLPEDTARVQVEIDTDTHVDASVFSATETNEEAESTTTNETEDVSTLDDWTDKDTTDEYECVCGEVLSTQSQLWGHQGHCDEYTPMSERNNEPSYAYKCDGCAETFPNKGAYATHCRWNHAESEDESKETTESETDSKPTTDDTQDDESGDVQTLEVSGETPTDQLFDDIETDEETASETGSKPFLNFPTLDELPDIDVYVTPGSDAFHITALLYRNDESLKMREIHEQLTGTDWEISYKSTSAQLSQLRNAGLVEKEDVWGGQWWLTQLGKQYVKATVYDADEYPLRVADELTGINSPSTNGNLVTAD